MKLLYILQKDLDFKVIQELQGRGLQVTPVCFRHRDFLVCEDLELHSAVSFPQYWEQSLKLKANRDSWKAELAEFVREYDLQTLSNYSYLDIHRSRKPGMGFDDDEFLSYLLVKFFLDLGLNNFDCCVGELSRSFNLICYDLCKEFDIEYLHFINASFQKGLAFCDDKFRYVGMDERWDKLSEANRLEIHQIVQEKIDDFVSQPSYALPGVNYKRVGLFSFLKKIWRRSRFLLLELKAFSIDRKYRLDQYYRNPIYRFLRRNRLINLKYLLNVLLWKRVANAELPEEPYFYFALHVQPETTSTLFGKFLIDDFSQQGWLVEQLIRQLPPNSRLVVKDHPFMADKRLATFYAKLAQLPQVHFLPPWFSQFRIMKHCAGVVTCFGTNGIEARMLGKPVCILTDSYYEEMNVFRAESIGDVQRFFNEALSKSSWAVSAEDTETLGKIYNSIYPDIENALLDFFPNQESIENIAGVVDSILEEIEFRKSIRS